MASLIVDDLPSLSKLILGMGATLAGNFNPATKLAGEYLCFNNSPIKLPDVEQIINMRIRGIIDDKVYKKWMRYLGYIEELCPALERMYEQFLSPMEYGVLYHRGKITIEELNKYFKIQKIWDQKQNILDLTRYVPNVEDLVRFAVREAYTPEVVKKFELDLDLPKLFLDNAKLSGLDEANAKNFWRAHWQLPSMQMGFEMLHRTIDQKIDPDADEIKLPSGKTVYNVIGKKTLSMLAKTQDISPFWRDKLTEISYHPLTRVDVRRMYSMGALDEDGVYRAYLEQGYNQEDANSLLNFVVSEYAHEARGLTRAQVVRAFMEDIITRDELIEFLRTLRMADDAVMFYVELAEHDKDRERIDVLVKQLSLQFQEGSITIDQIRQDLLNEQLPTTFIDAQIIKIQLSRKTKIKLPDKPDLIAFLQNDVIDTDEFFMKMSAIGYRDSDIILYLRLYGKA